MSHEKQPSITPQEFGFVKHEAGPDFLPKPEDLMPVFNGLVREPVPTQLLETDHGNQALLCSLIGNNPKLTEIARNIEDKHSKEPQHSASIQAYVLRMLKNVVDNPGQGVKAVVGPKNTIFYDGNVGVSNGRLLRVYMTKVGQIDKLPVYAKIAACRTKEDERRLYRALGLDGGVSL